MRSIARWAGAGLIASTLAAGCGAIPPTPSIRPLGPNEVWLPVVDTRFACGGVEFFGEFRLHGAASDPRIAWMSKPDGTDQALVWPPGTSARFVPALEVIGPSGTVIAREGDQISGGCPNGGGELVDFTTPRPTEGPDASMSGPAR